MKFYVIYRLDVSDGQVQGVYDFDTLAEARKEVAELRRKYAEPHWELELNIIKGRLLLPEAG